jgi:hypothetical protein
VPRPNNQQGKQLRALETYNNKMTKIHEYKIRKSQRIPKGEMMKNNKNAQQGD